MDSAHASLHSTQAVRPVGLPLRTYLTRLIWWCIAPLLVLAGGLSLYHAHLLDQERSLAAHQIAQQVGKSLDQMLRARIDGLQVLAQIPKLGDPSLRAAQWEEAMRFQHVYGADVVLANRDLQMVLNTRVPAGTLLPALPRPTGLSAVDKALQTGQPAVGDTFVGPIAHKTLIAIAVPVLRDRQVAYFLLTTLDTQQFQTFLEGESLPEGWGLKITDSQNALIARHDNPVTASGSPPQEPYRFTVQSSVAPWTVHLKIAQATYQAPVVNAGVGLAIALAVAIFMAFWGAGRAGERLNQAVASLGNTLGTKAPAPLIREVETVRHMLQRADESRDKAVAALRVSEEQLRRLNSELSATLQAIPDLLFDVDAEGRYIGIWAHNPALLAQQQAQLLGRTVRAMLPSAAADTVMQALEEAEFAAASFGKVIELELPDGLHWFELSVTRKEVRAGEIARFIVLSRDITERMRIQQALEASEFRWKFAVEGAGAGLWDWDIEKGTVFLTPVWKAMIGFADDEVGNSLDEWESRLHPQDRAKTLMALQRCMDGTTAHYTSEHRFRCKDGSYLWMFDRGMVVSRDAQGKPLRMIGMQIDVTQRKHVELELQKSEATLRAIADNVNIILFLKDLEGRYLYLNRQYESVFGINASDLLGRTDHALFSQELADELRRNDRVVAETGSTLEFEEQVMVGDQYHTYMSVKIPVRDAHGHIYAVCGIATDITQRKQAEVDLRIAAAAFESQEGMMVTDANSVILRVNRAFTEITGYSEEEIVGKTPRLLQSGRHDADFYNAMWDTVTRTGSWQGEVWDRRKNGEEYQKWLNISAVHDDQGNVSHYVGTHYDISERKKAEETIKELAFYDPLTRLPNRTLLHDRLQQALTASNRIGTCGAVLFIDLDHFKNLNDTLGHDTGDLLLQQVAQRISACVREGDTVARLGGDEFVVVLENLSSSPVEAANQTEVIGGKILAELNQKYRLGHVDHRSTASVGATIFQGYGSSLEDLLKQADLAMYKSKDSGRNVLRFFDPNMQSSVMQRAALENDLHEALQENQFLLYYQAQVDQGKVTGAEALVRWMHPQRGMVSPGEFIGLAEETGQIVPLGNWVLHTACLQLAAWAANPLTGTWTLSVNVSVQQFRQSDFVHQVLHVLRETGADPQRLKLELTESMLVDRVDDVIEKMMALKSIGVGFSLDDFGTGYSSLAYLKRLPLDQLKIDQSFVRDVLDDPNDAAIAQTIVALARSLGFGVIAEGVETQAQRDFLARAGCHAYQGYYFSRPLPLVDFEAFATR